MSRVLVVVGDFYTEIADALLQGALARVGEGDAVEVVRVAGAWEVPQAVAMYGKGYEGVVALGCVIRGETSHYDIVAEESARALMGWAMAQGKPVANGILTVNTRAQAVRRAGALDRGGWAMAACLGLLGGGGR